MALDVKSRAQRYEKLDFLGEGQVGRNLCLLYRYPGATERGYVQQKAFV